ncbi:hypothetical protein TNCV_4834751 [Trichonephila clavipes]|nr:hypothetical protein TNCV_4834751 [Trichonephila clavipes]
MFTKCILTLRDGGTLNSREAAGLLERVVEWEEMWEASELSQCILPQNWGETEKNRTVTYMVLKATTNNRCTSVVMNFGGLDLTQSRSGGKRNNICLSLKNI